MKISFIIIALLSIAWTTSYSLNEPNIQKRKKHLVKNVSLEDLVVNKAKYHGQIIQTQGYFFERFEERAVYSDNKITNNRNPKAAVWIQFSANAKRRFNFDSLSTKYITIRGIVDTTKKGHVGAYPCSLFNADLIDFK